MLLEASESSVLSSKMKVIGEELRDIGASVKSLKLLGLKPSAGPSLKSRSLFAGTGYPIWFVSLSFLPIFVSPARICFQVGYPYGPLRFVLRTFR